MKKIFLYFIYLIFPVLLSAQPEFSFHLYGGYSWHPSGQIDINLPPHDYRLSGIVWDSESFVAPQFYVFSAGYLIDSKNLPLRISFEYIHDKVFAETGEQVSVVESTDPGIPTGSTVKLNELLDEYSMAYGYNHLLIKALWAFWQPPLWQRKMRLLAGLGIGMVTTHVVSVKGEQQRGQYEWQGPVVMTEGALEFPVSHSFVLCLGVKYLISRVDQAGIINNGKLSTTLHTWQGVIGAGFVFK